MTLSFVAEEADYVYISRTGRLFGTSSRIIAAAEQKASRTIQMSTLNFNVDVVCKILLVLSSYTSAYTFLSFRIALLDGIRLLHRKRKLRILPTGSLLRFYA